MGNVVNDVVNVGSFGLIDDVTGQDAATQAMLSGQSSALQSQERMQERQMEFLSGERRLQEGQIRDLSSLMRQEAASTALQRQGYFSGLEDFNIEDDTGYQFRLKEGLQAAKRANLARGTLYGGGTLKELTRYASGLASQEYGAGYGRAYDRARGMAATAYDPSAITANQLSMLTGVGSRYTDAVNQSLASLGASQGQYYQNLGQINAADATAGWNSLMQVGQLGAMAFGGGMFSGGGGSPKMPAWADGYWT